VRILYGEGDQFGCWLDVVADAIVWHALGEPDAGAGLPPAALAARPAGAGAHADAAAGGAQADAGDAEARLVDQWLEAGARSGPGSGRLLGGARAPAGAGADGSTGRPVVRSVLGRESRGPGAWEAARTPGAVDLPPAQQHGGLPGGLWRASGLHRRAREVVRRSGGGARRAGPARHA